MKLMTTIVLAASTILGASTASYAATVFDTGTFGVDEDTSIYSGVNYVPPGRYKLTLDLSQAPEGVEGEAFKTLNYNFYCDFHDGTGVVNCGGDDNPEPRSFTAVSPTKYEATLTVDPPHSEPGYGTTVRTDYYDTCCGVRLDIYSTKVGTYTLSVGSVPEPATWALMIIGIGGVGSVMRRRNRSLAGAMAQLPALA